MRPNFHNFSVKSVRIAAAILALSVANIPSAWAEEPPQTLPGGLQRVPDAKVALAYIKPGIDLAKYKTILLQPLVVTPAARDAAPPPGDRRGLKSKYLLRDKDVADLQQLYSDKTREVLGEAGFKFVTTPQADTLIVAAEITKILLAAPIESERAGYAGRSRTYTKGNGSSITMVAIFADGGSGQIIAEAADRKSGDNLDMWEKNNRVENIADAKRAFRDWAEALRNRLTNPKD